MATQRQIDFWEGEIETCRKYMGKRHKVWRRLLDQYRMDYDIPGLPDERVIKISRYYTLVRQILASVSFAYPRVWLKVENENYERQAELLERAANAALELMSAKDEIRQATFDTLFCGVGWLKVGYNPAGDDAIDPAYVANDTMRDDFPYIARIDPFNICLDPLTPPHRLGHARYLIEQMYVPYEFVRNDERYVNRRQIKPISKDAQEADGFMAGYGDVDMHDEVKSAVRESKQAGEMVLLYEVHDRVHRKRLTFADGVRDPIEEIDHPMLEQEPVMVTDPLTGEQLLSGEFTQTGGYLVDSGFPYYAMRFDLEADTFWPLPPLAYVEDTQNLQVESISRRADSLKRFQRIVLGSRREREANANLSDTLENASDGEIVWVDDVATSFRELPFGSLPSDQLGLESDARFMEEQSLQVSQMAMGGGPKRTATEASLIASYGQLNREWMQQSVADAYSWIVRSAFRMMADQRYHPEQFVLNVAEEGQEPVYEAIMADVFKVDFKVSVEAGSMAPLVEQLEREDALQLFSNLIQLPEIDRYQAIHTLLKAHRVRDPDKMFKDSMDADATKAAQLENVAYLQTGGDPGVIEGEDHQVHIEIHPQLLNQLMQQMGQLQQMPAVAPLPGAPVAPHMQQQQQLQMAIQATQSHIQVHQQHMAQEAQAMGQGAPQPPGPPGGGGMGIQGVVQSNAQRVSEQVTAQAGEEAQRG